MEGAEDLLPRHQRKLSRISYPSAPRSPSSEAAINALLPTPSMEGGQGSTPSCPPPHLLCPTLLPTSSMARVDPRWWLRIHPHPPPPPSRPLSCPHMQVCPPSRDSGLHQRDLVPHPSARSLPVLRRRSPRRADQRDPLPCRGVLLGLSPVTDLSMEYRGRLSPADPKTWRDLSMD